MFYPNLEEVKNMSSEYNVIPIISEYNSDMDTPISIFRKLQKENYCFILESVEGNNKLARYSFIGRNPFLTFESNGNKITVTNKGEKQILEGNPVNILKDIITSYKSPKLKELPSFSGGAVGFFSYDIIRYFENLKNVPPSDVSVPESNFMFTDELVVFDHLKQKSLIIVNLHVDGDIEKQYNEATKKIDRIAEEISTNQTFPVDEKVEVSQTESNFTKNEFEEIVKKAKQHIKDGDIFQVVLSQRFKVETNVDPFNVYRKLRIINPSPYMYYLQFDNYTIVGASPEMLLRVDNGVVTNCPIAGTIKRGKDDEEDEILKAQLLDNEKEIAEHNMLVDLGRNDVGKICEFGSVKVTVYKSIEKFSHVMHIVSEVQGKLRKDKTVFDALVSILPAGTLSGAPKIRAMEIIDELENVKRGIYGGAICYIGFSGNFDSCITIRSLLFKDNTAYISAGAGIVADSIPENEYIETKNKAAATINALAASKDLRCAL